MSGETALLEIYETRQQCKIQFTHCALGCYGGSVLMFFFYSILAGYRKPCQQRYWQAVRSRPPAAYIPRCRRDGDYEPMQCDRQYCWCVEAQGTEINGTRSRGTVTCPPRKHKTLSVN